MSLASGWLTTDRLTLRRMTKDDFCWLANLYDDVEVTRYLGGTKTSAQVEEMLATRIVGYYDVNPGLGLWMTLERSSGRALGFHLLNHIQGETIIQVGFGLVRHAWGHGFATEMAEALLRYGFADLRLPRIVGMAHIENVASQGVLAKIGLHRNGERAFPHPAYASAGPMAWFERERVDWMAERPAGARRART